MPYRVPIGFEITRKKGLFFFRDLGVFDVAILYVYDFLESELKK